MTFNLDEAKWASDEYNRELNREYANIDKLNVAANVSADFLALALAEIERLKEDVEIERQGRIMAFRQIMDALKMPEGSAMVTENVVYYIHSLRSMVISLGNQVDSLREDCTGLAEDLDKAEKKAEDILALRDGERQIVDAMIEGLELGSAGTKKTADMARATNQHVVANMLDETSNFVSGLADDMKRLLSEVRAKLSGGE